MSKDVINFTQNRIRDLPSPISGNKIWYDKEVPELFCRISKSGKKSFVVRRWNNTKGYSQKITLGHFPSMNVSQARQAARKTISDIASGIDVQAEKEARKHAATTLEQLLGMYIDARSLKPRTVHEYKVVVDRHFEEWKTKKVTEITEKMVLAKHKEFTAVGKTTCNSAMRVLRALLRYANAIKITRDVATDVLAKARLWHKPKRKDRIISSDDLPSWLEAVESLENIKTKTYFLTLLYMGFRSTELLSTKWENVNMRTHTIKLIDTKNGTDHTLPIPQILWLDFKKLKAKTGKTPYLFPADDYPKLAQPLDRPKRAIKAVCAASGVEFSPHDCRRTFATIAEASGLTFTMIKRLLNHTTENEVTGGYIITEHDTLRDAIEHISATIQSIRDRADRI